MTPEEKVEHFQKNLNNYFEQVEKVVNSDDLGLCGFILVCCLIDYVVQYTSSKTNQTDTEIDEKKLTEIKYKNFVHKYLKEINPNYEEEKIFDALRCHLVHAFTVPKGILLTQLKEENKEHHNKNIEGNYILDLKQFYGDVKKAIEKQIQDLENAPEIKNRFKKEYKNSKPFNIYEINNCQQSDPLGIKDSIIFKSPQMVTGYVADSTPQNLFKILD